MSAPIDVRFFNTCKDIGQIVLGYIQKYHVKYSELPDPRIVIAANLIIEKLEPKEILYPFVENSFNNSKAFEDNIWVPVKEKNQNFFLKHADHIFGKLPTEQISAFKMLFAKKILSEAEIEKLWTYFQLMVRQAIKCLRELALGKGFVVIGSVTLSLGQIDQLCAFHGVKIDS